MGYFSIVISILIIILVLFVELIRPKKRVLDFLSGINIIYLMAFGIAPLYIYFFYDYTTWGTIKHNDIANTAFLIGSVVSIVCYVCILVGYYFAGKLSVMNSLNATFSGLFGKVTDKVLFNLALLFFIIGLVSLIFYINILGGLNIYLEAGAIIRSGRQNLYVSPFMFLKSFVPFLYISSFVLYALLRQCKKNKVLYILFFLFSLAGSFLHLYHSAGRMSFFIFIVTFPLAHIIIKNRIKWTWLLLSALLFFFIVVVGDSLWNPYTQNSIEDMIFESLANIGITIGSVIEEFTFPFTNIANNILLFPSHYNFRYGIDILLGVKEVLPSRLISFEFLNQESISQFNTKQFSSIGTIPIDTVSFGYTSFGIAGVMIVGLVFGFLAKFIESLFDIENNFPATMFYSAWFISVAFAVVYGEPGQVYSSNFRLIIATLLLALLIRPKKNPF